jgi:uncharacterized protein (DUF433 family)
MLVEAQREDVWASAFICKAEENHNMVLAIKSELLPLRIDPSGTIYVGDTRVMLELIILAYLDGSTAEEIADDYDTLDLGDIHTVLGYYLHHKDEVNAYMEERRQHADKVWAKIEAWQESIGLSPSEFRERLLARTDSEG